MKTFATTLVCAAVTTGCAASKPAPGTPDSEPWRGIRIESPDGVERPPFDFSEADDAFLDEVQHACFNYFWNSVSPYTGMVYDRTSAEIVSVAGVGFQLSALPIGVERGWVSRAEAEARARQIVTALAESPRGRAHGLFFHYLDPKAVGSDLGGYEQVVSTIDSGLLFAGLITASSYFGGDIAETADALIEDADWAYFAHGPHPQFEGMISLGWWAKDGLHPEAGGEVLPYHWVDSGDEHKLVTFLATGADGGRGIPIDTYYRLRRGLGTHPKAGPMVFFPYSGALFTDFFAHCWIDYRSIGVDDPAAHGVVGRVAVDWWENSRRKVTLHRERAKENPLKLPTLGAHAWGLSACDGRDGYMVAQNYPKPMVMPGARMDYDVSADSYGAKDVWHDGTVAPYAAGSSIMFQPDAALDALHYYRSLTNAEGGPLLWDDPAEGGFGFHDSFNLGKEGERPWVASDFVAIDQGPMILAIENARTGLIWDLFHKHPYVQRVMGRLGLERHGR